MKLDLSDIQRLYGPVLFVMEEKEMETVSPQNEALSENPPQALESIEPKPESKPQKPATPAELLKGSAVNWKLKKNSTLAFVMDEQEFKNRDLTGFLKQAIEKAKVPAQEVGFGIIDNQADSWDFSNLPVNQVWVFGTSVAFQNAPFVIEQGQVFVHDPLSVLTQDLNKQEILIRQLTNRHSS
ncbi:MAG: hypothetical protein R3B93_18685 [Bacteroidia bacterium]